MGNMTCPFCRPAPREVVLRNEFWYARWDKYPASKGHMLIISLRHISSYFEAREEEKQGIIKLVEECKRLLERDFHPDGYNIGINIGPAAGQTIMHLHVHLIPRYQGDMKDPRGGVRGAIPEKRIY